MSSIIYRITAFIGFSSVLLFLFCSSGGGISGTGSSTGNAKIAGVILDKNDEPAAGVYVYLIPEGYNPGEDEQLPDSMIDTTDEKGRYVLPVIDSSSKYNIYAVSDSDNTKLFLPGITMTGDSIHVDPQKLDDPGVIKVILPGTIDTADGYVYLPGTQLSRETSGNLFFNAGYYILIINSVPSATYPSLYYTTESDPSVNIRISDSAFTVASNDTVIVGSYTPGLVYNSHNSCLPNDEVFSVAIDHDGSKWFGTNTGEIAHFTDDTTWKIYNVNMLGVNSGILSIAVDETGTKWFGTHVGLVKYDGSSWTAYKQSNSGYPGGKIYIIDMDDDNNKWIGLCGVGMAKFDGIQWTVYSYNNSGLPSAYVYKLAVDNDNTVWVPTENGIVHYTGTDWIKYNTSNSPLPSNFVFSARVDHQGNKWFGTSNGEVVKFDGTDWTVYNKTNSKLPGYPVHTIAVDKKNNIWVGTENGQVVKFDNSEWTVYNTSNSNIPSTADELYTIAVDDIGNIWVAMYDGGVIVFGPELKY